jgi:hypothetical protein
LGCCLERFKVFDGCIGRNLRGKHWHCEHKKINSIFLVALEEEHSLGDKIILSIANHDSLVL